MFGPDDILLNNIAWTLRRFPMFAIPGDGTYRMQPIFVDDLAELAVRMAATRDNVAIDAVGPETFTFNEIVAMLKRATSSRAIVLHLPPALAQALASIVGRLMGDVMLTRDEVRGLMGNLLATNSPPAAPTRLSEWIAQHADQLGRHYASELGRRAPG
jgi:NADH dehydrogenase